MAAPRHERADCGTGQRPGLGRLPAG